MDVLSKRIAKAVQDGDEELSRLLNGLHERHIETIDELQKVRDVLDGRGKYIDQQTEIIHLMGTQKDIKKVKYIYDWWEDFDFSADYIEEMMNEEFGEEDEK